MTITEYGLHWNSFEKFATGTSEHTSQIPRIQWKLITKPPFIMTAELKIDPGMYGFYLGITVDAADESRRDSVFLNINRGKGRKKHLHGFTLYSSIGKEAISPVPDAFKLAEFDTELLHKVEIRVDSDLSTSVYLNREFCFKEKSFSEVTGIVPRFMFARTIGRGTSEINIKTLSISAELPEDSGADK